MNESKRKSFHSLTHIRYLLFGVPLRKCYCWGENIYAPCDGEVIVVEDGNNERKIVHWLVDSVIAIKNALFYNEKKDAYSKIAGNYIIIKYEENGYMAFPVYLSNMMYMKMVYGKPFTTILLSKQIELDSE